MKALKQVPCPGCGRDVQVTKHGKFAPHKDANVRCGWSGRRVETTEKNKNAS